MGKYIMFDKEKFKMTLKDAVDNIKNFDIDKFLDDLTAIDGKKPSLNDIISESGCDSNELHVVTIIDYVFMLDDFIYVKADRNAFKNIQKLFLDNLADLKDETDEYYVDDEYGETKEEYKKELAKLERKKEKVLLSKTIDDLKSINNMGIIISKSKFFNSGG